MLKYDPDKKKCHVPPPSMTWELIFFVRKGGEEWCHIGINTVDPRYLDFGYLE